MPRTLRIEADGGSRGNPGVAGYGALVRDADGIVLAERAAPLGKASNNVAEYSGLIAGLEAAIGIDPTARIEVAMDSKLVIEQMSGRWKIKHEDMRRLAMQAQKLVKDVVESGGSVTFTWIPRERNKAADKLSNDGMDGLTVVRDAAQEDASGDGGPSDDTDPSDDTGTSDDTGRPEESVHAGSADNPEGDRQPSLDAPAPTTARTPSPTPGPTPGPAPASRGSGEPTRIVLVRHGATALTEELRLDGRGGADPSLTGTGQAQAVRAAELVEGLLAGQPPRLTTSTLARAVETGAVIGQRLHLSQTADPAWDEQSFGDWDGASVPELFTAEGPALAAMRHDPHYRRPGGESHTELTERVLAAYEALVMDGGVHVVVCHRNPILVVLSRLLGLELAVAWRLATAPGSLTGIEAWPDGAATVAFTNRT